MAAPAYGSGAQPFVWQPHSLQELQSIREQLQGAWCYTAGATLLRTQWEAELKALSQHLVSLSCIPEMSGITVQGDYIVIGAMTRLKACAASPLVQQLSILHEAVLSIAAPSVRNLATIGGNIASGIGDTLPALLVYDAELQWMTCHGMEIQPVTAWLLDGGIRGRSEEDVLVSVHIPKHQDREGGSFPSQAHSSPVPARKREVAFYRKLGRREVFTASLVTVALFGEINLENGRWERIAIAAGGGSGLAMRLTESEQLLRTGSAEAAQAPMLAAQVMAEFTTYTDAFATEDYRKQAAGNMLGAELWQAFQP
ncbi:putative xanthine dehydrogenase subunit C [Paenibacillus silvae]|uniref:Xanthine dehydrogenase subunit C n=1 Tax=Paenibacillus silvae TaxID=1325358 RepID=A0ABQ1Z5F1_9BACL|nr:FAD binding domain-containing protein [Paenibacillus silvae]GGH49626.1 putative xanthine dehydrogenase subunit C [Paenibacillus silvae]